MQRMYWGWKVSSVLVLSLLTAAIVSCLPNNSYQRYQQLDGTIYWTVRRTYERIHFDARPIDVVIIGPSKTQLGVSAPRVQQQLTALGRPTNVENFSIIGDGRNVEWAIVNEIYKKKSPKVIVISVDDDPYPWGHPAFKYIAPASAIAWPPAPFLHDYMYDLAYLPFRQIRLFCAMLFPDVFGLRKDFDPSAYIRARTDFSVDHAQPDGKYIYMERQVSRSALLEAARQVKTDRKPSRLSLLMNHVTMTGDHPYLEAIAKLALSHGTHLIFVYIPQFDGPTTISDRPFLEKHGVVLDNSDLRDKDTLFQGWAHLNHAGAMVVSDRLANAILKSDYLGRSGSDKKNAVHVDVTAPSHWR